MFFTADGTEEGTDTETENFQTPNSSPRSSDSEEEREQSSHFGGMECGLFLTGSEPPRMKSFLKRFYLEMESPLDTVNPTSSFVEVKVALLLGYILKILDSQSGQFH